MHLPACVCLCARLLKNVCMDLDGMLRVDRCRDMDELINFRARSGSQSGSRDWICTIFLHFSRLSEKSYGNI